jgi:hypothetical protein
MIDILFFIIGLLEIMSAWRFIVSFLIFGFIAFSIYRFELIGSNSSFFAILLLCIGVILGWIWQIKHGWRKKASKQG